MQKKTLIQIIMEHLGVEEGEEFDILVYDGTSIPVENNNPFKFRENRLLNRLDSSSDDFLYLGLLIKGYYTIKKLPYWEPNEGDVFYYPIFNYCTVTNDTYLIFQKKYTSEEHRLIEHKFKTYEDASKFAKSKRKEFINAMKKIGL
jgi:hypothetical protein